MHDDRMAAERSLTFLFEEGARPTLHDVEEAFASSTGGMTCEILGPDAPAGNHHAKLLADNFTCDVFGLAPGLPSETGKALHRVDLDETFASDELEAVCLHHVPHRTDGPIGPAAYRSLMQMGVELARIAGVRAVSCGACGSLMSTDYFHDRVGAWLAGDAFPVRGLITLQPEVDGGMHSRGLALMIGHELRVEPTSADSQQGLAAIAEHIIERLTERGTFHPEEDIISTGGNSYRMELSANTRFVRVFLADGPR